MKFCTFTLIDNSPELAAKWGDPLFSANGFRPMAKYAALIDHYRQRWVDNGRDPGIAAEVPGLPDDLNHESVEPCVGDVIPALRAAHPSRVWAP